MGVSTVIIVLLLIVWIIWRLLHPRKPSPVRSRYISDITKAIVYERDGGICQDCGSGHNLEYDHIIPFSWGGGNEVDNIQLLCESCNLKKGNRWAG